MSNVCKTNHKVLFSLLLCRYLSFPLIREKRDVIIRQINQEEEEKRKLEIEIDNLTDRHSKLNEILSKRKVKKKDYDKTIDQTEAAYKKILESSQTLLHVLKAEVQNLDSHVDNNR